MISVSVIIPCLDIKKTINGCLNSINNQKYDFLNPNIEVICVVDGNIKDLNYLKLWHQKNRKNLIFDLKIIYQKKNFGAGKSRFLAYKHCKGEFITFLDDDDLWHERKLEEQLGWHLSNPNKIISTHFYSNGNDYVNSRMRNLDEISFRNLLIGGVRVATPTIMIRKSLWNFHPEKLRYCEDWLTVSMIASEQKIKLIPKLLAYRSKEALPIYLDKFSLSNHKVKLRFGKVKALFLLFRRKKLSLFSLIFLMIFQFILFFKSILKSYLKILFKN